MRRIIYSSLATSALTMAELEDLLAWSRVRNEADEITGLLLYFAPELARAPSFLQLLEGPADAVEATYARIAADTRHQDVQLVSRSDAPQRVFPDWTMGLEYVTRQDLARAVPGLDGAGLVVMAQLVENPQAAERLLLNHCVLG